jgi:hypothetical protein
MRSAAVVTGVNATLFHALRSAAEAPVVWTGSH